MPSYERPRGRGGKLLSVDEDFPGDHARYLSDRLTGVSPVERSLGERVDDAAERVLNAGTSDTVLRVIGGVIGTIVLVLVFVGVFR